jgi:hypothetical protein
MTDEREVDAVLITGVYGSGKSSVGAEVADVLEKQGERYGLLDLAFLAWGYPGVDREGAEHHMMLENLDDLRVAATQVAASERVGIEDVTRLERPGHRPGRPRHPGLARVGLKGSPRS